MVYIDIKDTTPVAFIPAHGWEYTAIGLEFKVKNTTDGREEVLPIISSNRAGFLVCIQVRLPEDFYIGEWQYRLSGTNGYIAQGLLMAYDGEHQDEVQYQSEFTTIQYGG